MSDVIITEDIQAIMDKLLAYEPLTDIVGESGVYYLQAEAPAEPPYLIIIDAGLDTQRAFGYSKVAWNGLYLLRSVTVATGDKAAVTIGGEIHKAAHDALDGIKIPIGGNFRTLRLGQGNREPSFWENVDDQNQFLHMGFRYFASWAPSE